MNKFLSFTTSIVAAGIIFGGCGGGGSSSDPTNTGYLVDDPIAGVDYNCGSVSGITDANGEFHYKSGDECVFSVGNVIIGKAEPDKGVKGKGFVTPMDLAGVDANDTDNPKVKKIAEFFLTFDNNLSDDKIVITDDVKKDFKNNFPYEVNLTFDDVSIDDIKNNFDPLKIHEINDTIVKSHLTQIDEVIEKIKELKESKESEKFKNSNSTSFTAVDIPLDSIKNKKIIFDNGKSYVEIREDYSFILSDGKESGNGSWEYENKTLYLWKGKPYEYTIQFSNSPEIGTTIKITERKGEEVKYKKITNIVSINSNNN